MTFNVDRAQLKYPRKLLANSQEPVRNRHFPCGIKIYSNLTIVFFLLGSFILLRLYCQYL